MRIRTAATAMIMMLFVTPALAQDTAGQAAQGQPAPVAPEKKICRTLVPTGSMMPKRICLTKAEWQEFGDENEKAVNAMLHRPSPNTSLKLSDF